MSDAETAPSARQEDEGVIRELLEEFGPDSLDSFGGPERLIERLVGSL